MKIELDCKEVSRLISDGQDDRLFDRLPSLRGKILADAIVDNRPEVFACEFKELGSCGFPNFEVSVGQ